LRKRAIWSGGTSLHFAYGCAELQSTTTRADPTPAPTISSSSPSRFTYGSNRGPSSTVPTKDGGTRGVAAEAADEAMARAARAARVAITATLRIATEGR
jgi:hypothetical protein